jgi:hypothetical protein
MVPHAQTLAQASRWPSMFITEPISSQETIMLNRALRLILAPFFFYPSAATALAAPLICSWLLCWQSEMPRVDVLPHLLLHLVRDRNVLRFAVGHSIV